MKHMGLDLQFEIGGILILHSHSHLTWIVLKYTSTANSIVPLLILHPTQSASPPEFGQDKMIPISPTAV